MKKFRENPENQEQFAGPATVSPESAEVDANGVPQELWLYRDQMQTWLAEHQGDLETFLEYRQAKFKVICGMDFFYRTDDHVISLSVPMFKEKIEAGQSLDVILFASFHEFAHLKSITELDPAGRKNHQAQYKYEADKVIRDQADPTKWPSLQPAYRQYYNILEDAIVNHLVFDTEHFGDTTTTGAKRNQAVREWYTTSAFCLYKDLGNGQGEYASNPDPITAQKEPVIYVGSGLGNLGKMTLEDYQAGFDWNKVFPPLKRSGQFLTCFIKNQMLGLSPAEIKDSEKNPQGQHELDQDVAMVFTRPIIEVYTTLLSKVLAKYKDNPEQYQRYLDFMKSAINFVEYSTEQGKTVSRNDVVDNVFNANVVNAKNEINLALAKLQYLTEVKTATRQLGLSSSEATFLDVFNRFKTHTRAQQYSWTLPLKYTAAERFKVNRHILEKIFTLLCILDDGFDVNLPAEKGPGEGQSQESGPKSENKPEWKEGDKVIKILGKDTSGQPIYGDKGVIAGVKRGADGRIISVNVEYYGESAEKMAANTNAKKFDWSLRREEVFEPDKNLAVISESESESSGQGAKDPRKQYKEDKEKEAKDKPKPADQKPEDQGQTEEEPDPSQPKPESSESQAKPDASLDKIIDPYRKFLDDMIAEDNRQGALAELKEHQESSEYQQQEYDEQRVKDLLAALKAAKQKNQGQATQEQNRLSLSDEKVVNDFVELEKKLAPYAEAMAQQWLQVINNIASQVEIVRDRYYRSGRLDVKKLQRHYAEVAMGADMEQKLLYEQFVEKITIELQPKMLRLILAIDNSGSMSGKLENMRMAIMLLNSSLRSLRSLFKDKMTQLFGADMDKRSLDVVCDTELYLFGNRGNARVIKPFAVTDLAFVDDLQAERPAVRVDQETLDTLLAFQKMTVNEDTYDNKLWELLAVEHENPELSRLIQENKLTEVILQVGDGDIFDPVSPLISHLRDKKNISIGGFAVGADQAEANKAVAALAQRHGAERVIPASSADQIVEKFGELLKNIIVDKIQKPMMDALDKIN